MRSSHLTAYVSAVAVVGMATVLTFGVYAWIQPNISLLFFPAVVIAAILGGYVSAVLATVLSAVSLAYFFVPPARSFNIGLDDVIRLGAFAVVSLAAAWLGSARRRAEQAQGRSLEELRAANETLRRVGDWPALVGPDTPASVGRVLRHAADTLHSQTALVTWETDDEPWRYVASSTYTGHIDKQAPADADTLVASALEHATFFTLDGHTDGQVTLNVNGTTTTWAGTALRSTAASRALVGPVVSSPFRGVHVTGRLFLGGVATSKSRTMPASDLIAREVGNSLDQLYVAGQTRDLAIREDRLRLSRDLHDGVLQALTGIRLELKSIGDGEATSAGLHDRLQAIIATGRQAFRRFPPWQARFEASRLLDQIPVRYLEG